MGNHTWASVSTSPPVWNSYPEAWLGVSLRDTGLGAVALQISTFHPSWIPRLGFSAKAGGFICAFSGLALPAPPLRGPGIYGQGAMEFLNVFVTTWRVEGRRVGR